MKTHWQITSPFNGEKTSACRSWSSAPALLSADPAEVDCKICQRCIEVDHRTDEEEARDRARKTARQTARSRAVTELIEEHRDEFEQALAVHEAKLVDEYEAEALRDLAEHRQREERRREKRRAELRAELEALDAT